MRFYKITFYITWERNLKKWSQQWHMACSCEKMCQIGFKLSLNGGWNESKMSVRLIYTKHHGLWVPFVTSNTSLKG